jgi:hypothetical protein
MSENSNYDSGEFSPPEFPDELQTSAEMPSRPSANEDGKKWVIPAVALGCGCVGLPFLLIVLGVFGLGGTARRLYRSTGTYQVYQLAADEVETNAEVREILGDSAEAGWTSQSTEAYEDGVGTVCMRFNVVGDDRSGSVYAEAENTQGAWQLHQLMLAVNGETEIYPIIRLENAAEPLCPNFDALDSESDVPNPDVDDAPPTPSTEI